MAVRTEHHQVGLALLDVVRDAAQGATLRHVGGSIGITDRSLLGEFLQLLASPLCCLTLLCLHGRKLSWCEAVGCISRLGLDHVDQAHLRSMGSGMDLGLLQDSRSRIRKIDSNDNGFHDAGI